LDLARLFDLCGFDVFIADSHRFHISKYSRSVRKSFLVPSPRFHEEKYIQTLLDIVKDYAIDLVLPIYEETFYISKYKEMFPSSCRIFTSSIELLKKLHDKWSFQEMVSDSGLLSIETQLINTKEDLYTVIYEYPQVLKACYSRASQKVYFINNQYQQMNVDIDNSKWIIQKFIPGRHFCTYSICIDGQLQALSIYPVDYTVDGHSCVNFQAVKHKKIADWIKIFIKKYRFTGQIGFDFIENEDGLFAIECNPRSTSGLHLLAYEKEICERFFNPDKECIVPSKKVYRKIGPGMLVYGWRKRAFRKFIKSFFLHKDIVFNKKDLMPFISQPIIFAFYIIQSKILKKSFPAMFTYDIDFDETSA
jgi:predicted ATP-grasp superfamily ATP-dependent carboligase